jgi:integrase/recombinase XerD
MNSFKDWLKAQGYRLSTVNAYEKKSRVFLDWLGREKLSLGQVEYRHLLELIRHCRNNGHSRKSVNTLLRIVQLYYKYRKQDENPALGLHIKGETRRLPHDLLEWEALTQLHESYQADTLITKRNKVLLGILIYQAIRIQELEKLTTTHLKLTEGKIQIPGGSRSNRRTLPLQASQILELQEYVETIRPELLKVINLHSDQLFLGPAGDRTLGNSVNQLMYEIRESTPEYSKITSTRIRESVIVYWLKTKDIRTVQYLAGHKYVSSTERYRELDLEHLKEQIGQYHPLN